MDAPSDGILLRIFTGESDTWEGKSLHRALVEAAKAQGLAGATVLQGTMGYGANSQIHTARLVDLSPDLPIVVEIVDQEAKIQAFLPTVRAMVQEGLVTWQRVNVILYRQREGSR